MSARRSSPDVSRRTRYPTDTSIVAIGDDRTDEELFCALPDFSVTVAVGNDPSSAKYRVADYRAVRRMRSVLHDPRVLTARVGSVCDHNGNPVKRGDLRTGRDTDGINDLPEI